MKSIIFVAHILDTFGHIDIGPVSIRNWVKSDMGESWSEPAANNPTDVQLGEWTGKSIIFTEWYQILVS